MSTLPELSKKLDALRSRMAAARTAADHAEGEECSRQAFALAVDATRELGSEHPLEVRTSILRRAIGIAFDCGHVVQARDWLQTALRHDPVLSTDEEWAQFTDMASWPDEWLVAAVRGEPPDESALDALVGRYWGVLYGRCRLLTANAHKADDLAQETWCRVLRNRSSLKPGRSFAAYLLTIATNLWRDNLRAARRAGDLADGRLISADAPRSSDDETSLPLLDALPDLYAQELQDQRRFMMDVDEALERLDPLYRDVLVSRFLAGESCAEIGRRHGRTEQAVSGWIRESIRRLRVFLNDTARHNLREAKL